MKKQVKLIIKSLLVPLLLLLGTAAIFFFSKGYRINFRDGEIERTGVVSIKTTPRRASVFIDEVDKGTTPRAFDGLVQGTHTLRVSKEGYYDWFTSVNVQAEQLIPYHITLFLKEPVKDPLFPIISTDPEAGTSSQVISMSVNETGTKAAFIVLVSENNTAISNNGNTEPLPNSTLNQIEPGTETAFVPSTLQIWTYQLRRRFWENQAVPVLIAEFTKEELGFDLTDKSSYSFKLDLSPNGELLLFTEERIDSINGVRTTSYQLISASEPAQTPVELSQLSDSELISWSNDSQHLLFTRGNELRSLQSSTLTQTVITDIPTDLIDFFWTTDDVGTVFITKRSQSESILLRASAEGGPLTTLLTYQAPSEDSTLPIEEPDTGKAGKTERIEEVNTITDILKDATDIRITPDNTYLILFSPKDIALYSLQTDTTEFFSADEPQFHSFSPLHTSFLFKEKDNSFSEFWFELEDRDPLHTKGPRQILNKDEGSLVHQLMWHPASTVLLFTKAFDENTDTLMYIDTETRISNELSEMPSKGSFAPDAAGKKILYTCEDSSLCLLTTQL